MKICNKSPPGLPMKGLRALNQSFTNPQSLPMAIPLKKFAALCEEVAIANGKITPMSSPTVLLHDISREWRELCKATSFKCPKLQEWTEKEVGAAEVIIAALTYLQRIGCNDIEKLLQVTLEHHRRQAL